MTFNGNDAIGLFKNGVLIDLLGTFNDDEDYAKNMTLVRKAFITGPNNVYDVNEWDVFPGNHFSDLGQHGFDSPSTALEDAGSDLSGVIAFDQSWPNPFDEQFILSYRVHEIIDLQNDLYNRLGQHVRSLIPVSRHQIGIYQYQISAQGLAPGMYLISAQTQFGYRDMKVVKR